MVEDNNILPYLIIGVLGIIGLVGVIGIIMSPQTPMVTGVSMRDVEKAEKELINHY